MPMIDVYAPVGVFADQHALARSLTTTLMAVEGVPDIVMFRRYTAAFVHELSADAIANVDGASNYVRVQVLTNAGALNRDKQLAVVNKLSEVSASAAGDPPPPERIWVLLTEAPDGGWDCGATHTRIPTLPRRRTPSSPSRLQVTHRPARWPQKPRRARRRSHLRRRRRPMPMRDQGHLSIVDWIVHNRAGTGSDPPSVANDRTDAASCGTPAARC